MPDLVLGEHITPTTENPSIQCHYCETQNPVGGLKACNVNTQGPTNLKGVCDLCRKLFPKWGSVAEYEMAMSLSKVGNIIRHDIEKALWAAQDGRDQAAKGRHAAEAAARRASGGYDGGLTL